jgi:hypothetical protein
MKGAAHARAALVAEGDLLRPHAAINAARKLTSNYRFLCLHAQSNYAFAFPCSSQSKFLGRKDRPILL